MKKVYITKTILFVLALMIAAVRVSPAPVRATDPVKITGLTCTTGVNTADKLVKSAAYNTKNAVRGDILEIRFTYGVEVNASTLCVTSTGKRVNESVQTLIVRDNLPANTTATFVYDGTAFVCLTKREVLGGQAGSTSQNVSVPSASAAAPAVSQDSSVYAVRQLESLTIRITNAKATATAIGSSGSQTQEDRKKTDTKTGSSTVTVNVNGAAWQSFSIANSSISIPLEEIRESDPNARIVLHLEATGCSISVSCAPCGYGSGASSSATAGSLQITATRTAVSALQETDPDNPFNPADPGDPSDPGNPADPDDPTDPGDPGNPTDPDDPPAPEICNISAGYEVENDRDFVDHDAIGVSGGTSCEAGETVTLTATLAEGTTLRFEGWYRDQKRVSTEREYTFTATEDGEFTAKFINRLSTPPEGKTNLIYNGVVQELVEAGVPYEGKLLYEVIPEDGASTGSTPSHGQSTVSSLTHGSFSQSIPSARDAGTYEVFYRFEGDETVFRTDPVKIERKKIKEIIDDKEKCEEEDDPVFSVSYEGVLQADLRDGSAGLMSPYGLLYGRGSDFSDHHILSREAGEEPGTYEIRWVETEETVGTDGTDPYAPTGSGEDGTGEEAAPSGNYEIEETVNGHLTIKEIPSHEVTVRIVNEGDPAGLANITVRGGGMYKEGKPVTLLALSAKPITKFLGWYDGDAILTEEGTYSFDQGTADTVFTARFYTKIIPVGKTYKLTFEADGEETQVVSLPVSFDPDTGDELEVVYTLPECRFTVPPKMVFDGWEIGGERYAPGDSLRITNDETVSPVWTKKYFSVKGLMDTYVYTGKQIRPMPQVFYGNDLLKERTDYSLSYRNNLNTGKATLIVSGRGSYAMNMQYTYEIVPADIGADDITADDLFLSYNGRAQMPAVSVKRNGKALRNNTDYTLSWKNENGIVNGAFTASGEYDITIIGKKNYTGKRTVKAVVALPSQELLSKAVISRIPDQACSGKIVKPDFKVTLKNRELTADDFDVLWPDDLTSPGLKTVTLRGKGNYRGIKRFTYKIVGVPIAKAVVTLPKTYAYTGMEIMPMGATAEADTNGVVVSVRVGNGEPVLLQKNVDYTVTYQKNVNAGNAAILLTGMGKYVGQKRVPFKIRPNDLSKANVNPTRAAGTLPEESFQVTYDKKVPYCMAGAMPSVKIVHLSTGTALRPGVDYTVSYRNNRKVYDEDPADPAKEPVIIVTGKGNYKGKIKQLPFAITPREPRAAAKDKDISKARIVIRPQKFVNEPVVPDAADIEIRLNNREILKASDYRIIQCACNDRVGTAFITFEGVGGYGGEKTARFRIVKQTMVYTVHFHANGGTGVMQDQNIGTRAQDLKANTFRRPGYTFLGWSGDPDGSGKRYEDKQSVSSLFKKGTEVTLYAIWNMP